MAEIKTTLGAIISAEEALKRLSETKLPMKAAYHVAKLIKLVSEEAKLFHTQREATIKELGTERDPTPAEAAASGSTKVISVKPENVIAFQSKMMELSEIPVSIP